MLSHQRVAGGIIGIGHDEDLVGRVFDQLFQFGKVHGVVAIGFHPLIHHHSPAVVADAVTGLSEDLVGNVKAGDHTGG